MGSNNPPTVGPNGTITDQISGGLDTVTDPLAKSAGAGINTFVKDTKEKNGVPDISNILPKELSDNLNETAARIGEDGMFGMGVAGVASATGSGKIASALWGGIATYAARHNWLGIGSLVGKGGSTMHALEGGAAAVGLLRAGLEMFPATKGWGDKVTDVAVIGGVLAAAYFAFKPTADKYVLSPLAHELNPAV